MGTSRRIVRTKHVGEIAGKRFWTMRRDVRRWKVNINGSTGGMVRNEPSKDVIWRRYDLEDCRHGRKLCGMEWEKRSDEGYRGVIGIVHWCR